MRIARFRRRLISLLVVAFVTTIGFWAVHKINQANALATVSSDYITLGYSVSTEGYNNGEYGNHVEWNVAPGDVGPTKSSDYKYFTYRIYYKIAGNPEAYNPGDLRILVKNPFPSSGNVYSSPVITVGANGGSVNSHEWRLTNYRSSNSYGDNDLIIENDRTFDAGMNAEGSIDVAVGISMNGITYVPRYENSTHREYNSTSKVILNNTIESDEVTAKVSRDFSHPWYKANYSLNVSMKPINSYDGILGVENPDDYYWLIHTYDSPKRLSNGFLNYCQEYEDYVSSLRIGLKSHEIKTKFGENTIVISSNRTRLYPDNDGYTTVPQDQSGSSSCNPHTAIVGYPKSFYNAENNNLEIVNVASVYGTYANEDSQSYLTTSGWGYNLSDYDFVYDGKNVAVKKDFIPSRNTEFEFSTAEMKNGGAIAKFSNKYTVRNVTRTYTARFGDDVLFRINNETAATERLSDNDYRFKSITFPKSVAGGNDLFVPNSGGYSLSVFVRKRGQSGYERYNTSRLSLYGDNVKVTFKDSENIVGWYVQLSNMSYPMIDYELTTEVQFEGDDWPDSGTVYNFNYARVTTITGLMNSVDEESYAEGITRSDVMQFDIDTYGEYRQRSVASFKYDTVPIEGMTHYDSFDIHNMSLGYNPETDNFEGEVMVREFFADLLSGGETDWTNIAGRIKDEDKRHFLTYYFIMPKGVILDYSADEIKENIQPFECTGSNPSCKKIRNADTGELLGPDTESFDELAKSGDVQVFRNFRDTGRYVIKFTWNFDEPMTTFNQATNSGHSTAALANYMIKYHITHDTYDELGPNYTFYVASDGSDFTKECLNQNYCDNGSTLGASELTDIDGDGNDNEYLYSQNSTIRLTYASSTIQDTQTTVKGDVDGVYLLEDAMSSLGGEYYHRLRIRSGENKISNVVLYDNIEQAFGNNEHWQGEFLGVDTSYAESQSDVDGNPVKVKVYWSNKTDAGNLDSDDSWEVYDDSVDKSSVKSLAFEFLKSDGVTPAKLPNATNSYVTIKMRAPSTNTSGYAYNSFRSTWQSTDPATGQVLSDVTGLDSNTTTISLDNLFGIHVINRWVDYNNTFNLRPDSLNFALTRGGMNEDSHALSQMSDEDNFDFTGLHLYDKNAYKVELPPVEYYSTKVDYDPETYTYIFTHTLNIFDINIVHEWEDYGNKFNLRPSEVSYDLTKSGTKVDSTTGSGADWKTSFNALPLAFEGDYKVAEDVEVENYTTSLISYDPETHTYTFKSVLKVVDVNETPPDDTPPDDEGTPVTLDTIIKAGFVLGGSLFGIVAIAVLNKKRRA